MKGERRSLLREGEEERRTENYIRTNLDLEERVTMVTKMTMVLTPLQP